MTFVGLPDLIFRVPTPDFPPALQDGRIPVNGTQARGSGGSSGSGVNIESLHVT